ncbi:DUF596 domain-containing protein [Klebsiella pneumoniae]|nr:DUF596 domain-containing protein [Klebsiella pneumoniae]
MYLILGAGQEWETRGEHLWFYEDDCPGGIVWIHDSGYEDWT